MSATYDTYEKRLLQGAFSYQQSEILTFQNLHTLVSGVDQGDFDLKSEVDKDATKLKESIKSLIRRDLDDRPFIVFMAKHDEQLVEELRTICDEREVLFVEVMDQDEADEQRRLYDNATRGVFVLDRAFGRSYDLKLGAEAQVLILANAKTITHTEAIQMVGRGCRSQGQG